MASLSRHQVRAEVMDMYPGSITWQSRVNRMPDNQVFAIWRSKQERKACTKEDIPLHQSEDFHQITIFEYLNEVRA